MSNMKNLLFLVGFATLFLAACGESHTLTFRTPPVVLTAEGPLFEGSNTAQGQFGPALADFLKQQGYALSDLDEATLTKATLSLPDSLDSDLLSEVTLQLAADQVDMQKVGVLNPVPANQTQLELQTAREQQKIKQLLQQNTVLVVADVNLRADTATNWTATGVFEFSITVNR
jgi:hypothetical protein